MTQDGERYALSVSVMRGACFLRVSWAPSHRLSFLCTNEIGMAPTLPGLVLPLLNKVYYLARFPSLEVSAGYKRVSGSLEAVNISCSFISCTTEISRAYA